jgi:hypothetical protein
VLVETPKAITIMPPGLAEAIACDAPNNVEDRDYFAVEHAVWAARAEIGDFPMTVISNDYGEDAPPGDEQTNVPDQRGWLVLSPSSEQVVLTSGHDVAENEPELVVREIRAVLNAAPEQLTPETGCRRRRRPGAIGSPTGSPGLPDGAPKKRYAPEPRHRAPPHRPSGAAL